jgi:poly(3-hydroxybutyrate) depolymerase
MRKRFFKIALNVSSRLIGLVNRTNGSLVSLGKKQSYLLYVPETYNPAAPTPLVISLHGLAEWPAHQRQISRWNELPSQYGFIVVYPCGTRLRKSSSLGMLCVGKDVLQVQRVKWWDGVDG